MSWRSDHGSIDCIENVEEAREKSNGSRSSNNSPYMVKAAQMGNECIELIGRVCRVALDAADWSSVSCPIDLWHQFFARQSLTLLLLSSVSLGGS